jgi:hypothetical protein
LTRRADTVGGGDATEFAIKNAARTARSGVVDAAFDLIGNSSVLYRQQALLSHVTGAIQWRPLEAKANRLASRGVSNHLPGSNVMSIQVFHSPGSARLGFVLACAMAASGVEASTVSDFGKDLERGTSLHHFQVDKDPFVGQRFEFNCPAKTVRDKDPVIYGTDVYPANTPLCVAAQHAGVISANGGSIQLQLNPGVSEYRGSRKNGVESQGLPGTQLSIMFMSDATRAKLDDIQQQWKPRLKWDDKFSQTGLANIRLTGQRFAFECPAVPSNTAGRAVFGTDSYPLHSIVCLTAVHAGQISKAGGSVLIQMDPALEGTHVGSIRNGIESKNWQQSARSVSFPGSAARQSMTSADDSSANDASNVLPEKNSIKGMLKKSVRSLQE